SAPLHAPRRPEGSNGSLGHHQTSHRGWGSSRFQRGRRAMCYYLRAKRGKCHQNSEDPCRFRKTSS
ncbi:hypothetical protein FRC01_010273, partial [Tulasnella sp. 417]